MALTSALSLSMSTLFTRKTTFLPHCRMYFRKRTSLSVKGRSAHRATNVFMSMRATFQVLHTILGL